MRFAVSMSITENHRTPTELLSRLPATVRVDGLTSNPICMSVWYATEIRAASSQEARAPRALFLRILKYSRVQSGRDVKRQRAESLQLRANLFDQAHFLRPEE
jgi:hypothetical protein